MCPHCYVELHTKMFSEINRLDLDKMYEIGANGHTDGIIMQGGGFPFLQAYQDMINEIREEARTKLELIYCPKCFRVKSCNYNG